MFGSEPGRTWCTYFEKADLARQQAHWKDVLQLWREASESSFAAGNGVELLPFIEAFAQEGSWAEAPRG